MNTHRLEFAFVLAALGTALVALPAVAQDELIVANAINTVTVYSRAAMDNEAPLLTLSGAGTGLSQPGHLVHDSVNNELFVANNGGGGSITVYSQTAASGIIGPLRTLSGAATGLSQPLHLAVDPVNDELFVASSGANAILVFSRAVNGNIAPLRILSGGATGLAAPLSVTVDLTNNELFVGNSDSSITVYSRTAGGNTPALRNTPPLRTLVGAATGLVGPLDLFVDPTNNELFVANVGISGPVTVYRRTAIGNEAPLRTLSGALTGLASPHALTLAGDELFVGNALNANSITVYNRAASGNILPLRTLKGAATGLGGPVGLAVSASATPPPPTTLVAAVLPNARAVQVLTPVTVNATVINAGGAPAVQVGISLASLVPSSFGYWLLDASGQFVGAANTPVDIPACAPPAPCPHADFVIFMTPTGSFGPTELFFTFAGINTPPVAALVGINTLLLLASATPTPDMVALAATSPNDGIARIPGVTGTGFFVVATKNLGIADTITVSADTGGAAVPVDVLICETDPATSVCLAPAGPTVTVTTFVAAGATPTFAFFVRALGVVIPLDPAVNRVFARFRRSDTLIVGGTSAAVMTQ